MFKTEEQLCEAFRDWCAGRYDVHPEPFSEWDLVLEDFDGRRLGVQAKLSDGLLAVAQCVEGMKKGNVEAAAILMPSVSSSLRRLCTANSFGWFSWVGTTFLFAEPTEYRPRNSGRKRLPMTPSKLPAGVPSPRSIKDGEFMLEVIMHQRGGYLTNKDFQRVGWPERFHPNWLFKLKGRPRWEPTLTAVFPSQLDPSAYEAMKERLEARGLANV